jgi:heme exporter protein D
MLFSPRFALRTGLSAMSLLVLLSCPVFAKSRVSQKELQEDARRAFIRKAQVWTPTNIPAMDLRAGPPGKDALSPNETVMCDYVETKLTGSSRKFDCAIREGDIVRSDLWP